MVPNQYSSRSLVKSLSACFPYVPHRLDKFRRCRMISTTEFSISIAVGLEALATLLWA